MMRKNIILRSFLGAAFVLSLTANIAAAGAFSGGAANNPFMAKISAAIGVFADLSPQSREKTIDIAKASLPALRSTAQDIRTRRAAVLDMLAKPDYKRADAEKLLAVIRTETDELQQKGQATALDVADALTPGERAEVVKMLQANFPRLTDDGAKVPVLPNP